MGYKVPKVVVTVFGGAIWEVFVDNRLDVDVEVIDRDLQEDSELAANAYAEVCNDPDMKAREFKTIW